ncbi:hypothetical protein NE237_025888 [Protea cynaroides]|uniref:Glycosyltransferase n=1 Tax=Protea cynaroides TaxID=273540 RepID=A0A9Q0H2Q7_9MAGN|nr:hypothetical protein NE237_025888 [Protea cynaroides]
MEHHHHFLVLAYPLQGHINPALQFAKHVLLTGARVTFVTSFSAYSHRENTSSAPPGLTFAPFSDGHDAVIKINDPDPYNHVSEIKRIGSKFTTDLIANLAKEGRPITCIVYSLIIPWAAQIARDLGVPSALLWIQPATVFNLYYHYFHGYEAVMTSDQIELPGLPLLTSKDVPSFFFDSNKSGIQVFQEHFETLEQETKPWVLVNTFDALEPQSLRAIAKFNLIGIGPLLNNPSDKSFRADLFHEGSKDYMEWLNSKMDASVVYVSFGSLAELSKPQMEAIGNGLLESRRPFLWVIREGEEDKEKAEIMVRFEEKNPEGLIVPWCSQVDVLSHPSVGCFVTHCGWNSTLEGLVAGVPMVGFPCFSDQPSNVKLIQDVWRTGVRVRVSDEDGIVKSEEIVRCLKMVMEDESGEEMRKAAKRWSVLSREAVKEGGSSHRNIRDFMKEIGV